MNAPVIRSAVLSDLPAIVAMLADDPLGSTRESPDDLDIYELAFAELDVDPHQLVLVAEQESRVVGTAQLTMIRGLSRRGARRAQIEGVRISAEVRGAGLGEQLIQACIERARQAECTLVQLTSDASREGARRFYERLGFAASHVGFKLDL